MNFGRKRALTKRSRSPQESWGDDRPGSPLQGDPIMKDQGKRQSRNLSEKKRRDQFNMLVNELCAMVSNNRKMDKTTVIKTAISVIEANKTMADELKSQEIHEEWKPSFMSNNEFVHLMLEAVDGFILVVAVTGKIMYVSESVTALLGHVPDRLCGKSLLDLIHTSDRARVHSAFTKQAHQGYDYMHQQHSTNELRISFHMKCGSKSRTETPLYELVQLQGFFKQFDSEMQARSEMPSNTCICCTVRLKSSQIIRELASSDETKKEFTSRHSLEWKFLFLDHRGPPIIGYLPFEVLGTSGYDYVHPDDLSRLSRNHEQLMQSGEGKSCYYRFMTKGQQWIWLQSRYYITFHQWNSKPEFVVCTNTVVSYADVEAELQHLEANGEEESMTADTNSTGNTRAAHSPSREPSSTSAWPSESSVQTPSSTMQEAFTKSKSMEQQPSSSVPALSPTPSPATSSVKDRDLPRMRSDDGLLNMRSLELLRERLMHKKHLSGPSAVAGRNLTQKFTQQLQKTKEPSQLQPKQEPQQQATPHHEIPPLQPQTVSDSRMQQYTAGPPPLEPLYEGHQQRPKISASRNSNLARQQSAPAAPVVQPKSEPVVTSQHMNFPQGFRLESMNSPVSSMPRSPDIVGSLSSQILPSTASTPKRTTYSPSVSLPSPSPSQVMPVQSPSQVMPVPSPSQNFATPPPSQTMAAPSPSQRMTAPSPSQLMPSPSQKMSVSSSSQMMHPPSPSQIMPPPSPSQMMQAHSPATSDLSTSSQARQVNNIQQQLHFQLLEKHRQLQAAIMKQQQELQKISEQLLFASQFSVPNANPTAPDTSALGTCLSMLMPSFDLDPSSSMMPGVSPQVINPGAPLPTLPHSNPLLSTPSNPEVVVPQQAQAFNNAQMNQHLTNSLSLGSLSSLDNIGIPGSPMSMMLAQDSLMCGDSTGHVQGSMLSAGADDAFNGTDSQPLAQLPFDAASHGTDASGLFNSQSQ